jgi:hypothetical protein
VGEKLLAAMERALPWLAPEVRKQFEALFTPENRLLLGTILGGWVLMHFAGTGEAVDAWLGLWMAWSLGSTALQCFRDLFDFVSVASHARTETDLDRAARSFARFVAVGGATALLALIARRGGKQTQAAEGKVGGQAVLTESPAERSAGETAGPWWDASEFGENFPQTTVPQGFRMTVSGREFRVTPNACKHMAERILSPRGIRNPWGDAQGWPRSPWNAVQQVDYPLSSLAGALEQATRRLIGKPGGRHSFTVGNWELGIDTADTPWAVFHARPITQ